MLSRRGADWANVGYAHGPQSLYHPQTNPNGVVDFGNAENRLIQSTLMNFINDEVNFDEKCLSYGEGYTGTLRLRTAMGKHLTTYFKPVNEIDPEEVTFAAGVTDLNEVCALLTCDEGEAIMLGRPVYGAFYRDFTTRTGVRLEYASVGDTDQFGLSCVAGFEATYEDAKRRGVRIKALVICNPHNPLGRCYPRETLVELLRLCGSKGIHLISDEIYALSVYQRDDRPCETFISVRAIDMDGLIGSDQVHVLYGMSKDYGAGGLRLGCLITQNKEFRDATRAVCRFSSPSQLSMDVAAKFLENASFVKDFLLQSHSALRDNRLLAESLLDEHGIPYSKEGNAGLFMWLDLGPFLPAIEAGGDVWDGERLLNRRLREAGVILSYGEAYHAPKPGRFRLVFSLGENVTREGIKRISQVISLTVSGKSQARA